MRLFLSGIAVATLLTGCATGPSVIEKTVYTGFSAQSDGGQFHGGTGLVCPPTLLELPIASHREYGDQSNDASCGYRDDSVTATVFLSDLNYSFRDVFGSSVRSMLQGGVSDDAVLDEDASMACQLGRLIAAAGSPSQDTSTYNFDAAVASSDTVVTLVQLTDVEGRFLKLRYTLLDTPASAGLNSCLNGAKALREVYDLTLAKSNAN